MLQPNVVYDFLEFLKSEVKSEVFSNDTSENMVYQHNLIECLIYVQNKFISDGQHLSWYSYILLNSAEWVDKTNNKSERFNRKFKTYLNECRVKKDINIIQDTVFAYIIHHN